MSHRRVATRSTLCERPTTFAATSWTSAVVVKDGSEVGDGPLQGGRSLMAVSDDEARRTDLVDHVPAERAGVEAAPLGDLGHFCLVAFLIRMDDGVQAGGGAGDTPSG